LTTKIQKSILNAKTKNQLLEILSIDNISNKKTKTLNELYQLLGVQKVESILSASSTAHFRKKTGTKQIEIKKDTLRLITDIINKNKRYDFKNIDEVVHEALCCLNEELDSRAT
jgi:hypothetical protein